MMVVNNALINRVAMDQIAMNSHSLMYIVSLPQWYSKRHWVLRSHAEMRSKLSPGISRIKAP